MEKSIYFDDRAQSWDADVSKVERAQAFASKIIKFVKLERSFTAMEYGCGTGLLSIQLRDKFAEIFLVDTSAGMLSVLKQKIEEGGIANFRPTLVDLQQLPAPIGSFDVIFTMMTLHHVADIPSLLAAFWQNMAPGGYLCISDLVSEDGSFHANDPAFDGHHGFERAFIGSALVAAGFTVEQYEVYFTLSKMVKNQKRDYPLFCVIAQKP